jgi:hypothetical protein
MMYILMLPVRFNDYSGPQSDNKRTVYWEPTTRGREELTVVGEGEVIVNRKPPVTMSLLHWISLSLSISLSPLPSCGIGRKLCSKGELKNLGLWHPICHDFVDVRTPICHETLSDTVAATEHVTLELWCVERLWSFRRLLFEIQLQWLLESLLQ